ncbi:MAG: carboxypeptidase-like regulatory domain-containing protein, partial [Thermoanaerobaculales bacterium]|nr:carboxypeptidase-like regulatory domain-containing protein [Thermoanaerobaculales bacterium]
MTVTIASPSLIGGARTEVTDERGEALFLTLGPGTYEAKAAMHGFATQERTEVWVRLGSLTALNVTMPEATFEGEIEVVADTPVIDPQQIGTEQVFDAEYIEKTAVGTWDRFGFSPGA